MSRVYTYTPNQPANTDTQKKKLSYSEASQLRKKSLSKLLLDELLEEDASVTSAIKKTISDKTKASVTGIKQKFDPLNIVKFLTFGSKLAPTMLGKMTGRKEEDIKFFSGDTKAKPVADKSTKLGPLEGGDEGLIAILSSIYSLLKKTHEDEIGNREKRNNFLEEKQIEDERRHNELLRALGVKVAGKDVTATKEDNAPSSPMGIVEDILGAFGGIQMIKTIGTWFLTGAGATLLTIVAAGALGGWLGEKFKEWKDEKAQNLGGDKAAAAMQKMKGIDDTDSEAYKKAEGEYNDAIKEKQLYVRQFLEQKGYKTYLKTNLFGKETGQYYYEKPNGKGPTSEEMKEASKYADEQLTTAQKVPPANTTPTSQPTDTSTQTPPVTPTTSNPSGSSSTNVSATPESIPTSDKVNITSADNASLKLQEAIGAVANEVVNNSKVINSVKSETPSHYPIPSVRNSERSFQKMILDSTRIV